MKKLMPLLFLPILWVGCTNTSNHRKVRTMVKEIVVNYDSSSEEYLRYGSYKAIYRKYNYEFKDSQFVHGKRNGNYAVDYMVNEFGDTISFLFTDFTNYPRREEDYGENEEEVEDYSFVDSLVSWTPDIVIQMNPELVELLEPLYQYVMNGQTDKSVKEKEIWMNEYREKLCSFYDSHHLGCDTISQFAKADTVLNTAERLYEIGNDGSTMGVIVCDGIESTFDEYREYALLSQMLVYCKEDSTKQLIYREWDMYESMFGKMGSIVSDVVSLNFWGGSAAGIIRGFKYSLLSHARRESYHDIYNMLTEDTWKNEGVFLSSAESLLFDCIEKAIQESSKGIEYIDENKSIRNAYKETIANAEKASDELRPMLKEWQRLWAQIDSELAHDVTRHEIERAASTLLIKWASIISSTW